MVEADAAESDSGDEALISGLDHRGQLPVETVMVHLADRRWITGVDAAQIDRGKAVDAQRAQVVLDAGPQLVGLLCGQPPTGLVAARSHLADQGRGAQGRDEAPRG